MTPESMRSTFSTFIVAPVHLFYILPDGPLRWYLPHFFFLSFGLLFLMLLLLLRSKLVPLTSPPPPPLALRP